MHEKSVKTCGRCRKIYKYNLVEALLKNDRVYLSEKTRNKNGRPSTKITDPLIIRQVQNEYANLKSYRLVANKLNLKVHQVASALKKEV